MLDELGCYELSCMGHKELKTPNIDRMASEGMRFTQALAGGPVCAPTRCVLLTGKNMGNCTITGNGEGPIRAEEETIASVLKKAGYSTGGFGKWGLGERGTAGVPEKHGFDVFYGYYHQLHAHDYYTTYLVRNSELVPLKANLDGQNKQYSHYLIYNESIKFIEESAGKKEPFFCYLPWTPPHGPFAIPANDPALENVQDIPAGQARTYAAMVNMADRQIGEVFALLKELAIDDNTIVFVCGDNGGHPYFQNEERPRGYFGPNVDPNGSGEFRGGKWSVYEGGLRIPFIVRWPGKIEPGQVSNHLCCFPDIMPTLSEIAGVEPPADVGDGISIIPTLLGESIAGRKQEQHEYLYWTGRPGPAVRMKNWKLILPRNGNVELYDLGKDIGETTNVAFEHPEVVKTMTEYSQRARSLQKSKGKRMGEIFDASKCFKRGDSKKKVW